LNAACIFGEMFAPPPPKKKPRRGVVDVPVLVPVPLPLPAGRAGSVTPCAFRQEASCARRALFAPPPAAAPEEEPEAEAEAVVLLVVVLELLALPHAASAPPATRVTSATATRLDLTSNTFNTASFRE
jgi:hypothetical protein